MPPNWNLGTSGRFAFSICVCGNTCKSWAFMVVAAGQAGDADSSRAPGLTSGLQGSVTVHQFFCILHWP